jgi:hypothetical protein
MSREPDALTVRGVLQITSVTSVEPMRGYPSHPCRSNVMCDKKAISRQVDLIPHWCRGNWLLATFDTAGELLRGHC